MYLEHVTELDIDLPLRIFFLLKVILRKASKCFGIFYVPYFRNNLFPISYGGKIKTPGQISGWKHMNAELELPLITVSFLEDKNNI